MSVDSWHEPALIFMKIHENYFMNVYRIDPKFVNSTFKGVKATKKTLQNMYGGPPKFSYLKNNGKNSNQHSKDV